METPEKENNYTEPILFTKVPGPQSLALCKQLNDIQDTRTVNFFVNYEKSKGCYLVDADGNIILDLFGQIASLPLGYNHRDMIEVVHCKEFPALFAQRPALGIHPPIEMRKLLEETLLQVTPKGLSCLYCICSCGAGAIENAFKAAFIWKRNQDRGSNIPTQQELSSCLENKEPGSPAMAILSFEKCFHGRTLGALSATRSKAMYKVDVPSFGWPVAPFPQLRFPLEENEDLNQKEENRSLSRVEDILQNSPVPIAAIIVEPILAEGGDLMATPRYYCELRKLALKYKIAFIVDEVQTGCGATGTFWAHEQWNLPVPPDIVTFGKKMQVSGFYTRKDFIPEQPSRIFNTWMGDALRLLQLRVIIDVIKRDHLLDRVTETGSWLKKNLEELARQYPNKISMVRGVGTFIAMDAADSSQRDRILSSSREKGLQLGGCGEQSIRLRPCLIFGRKEAATFIQIFGKVLSEV